MYTEKRFQTAHKSTGSSTHLRQTALQDAGNQSLLNRLIPPSGNRAIQRAVYKAATGMISESRGEASSSDVLYRGASTVDPLRGNEFNTYHHIIPMNQLTSYWNKLISFEKKENLKSLMGQVLAKAQTHMQSAPAGTAFRHIPAPTAANPSPPVRGENSFSDLKVNINYIGDNTTKDAGRRGPSPADAMDEIISFYQWLPGNLVLGPDPAFRPNDGKEGFDYEAAYARERTEGVSLKYLELYNKLAEFNDLTNYDIHKAKVINALLVRLAGLTVYIPPAGNWQQNPATQRWTFRNFNLAAVK